MLIKFISRILFLSNISSKRSWFVCCTICGLEMGLCMHSMKESVEFIPLLIMIIEFATFLLGCAVWEQVYDSVRSIIKLYSVILINT